MSLTCPKCDKTLTRTRRKSWMHHVPGSKSYVCRGCGHAYLLIFNRWLLRRKHSPQKKDSSRGS